MAIHSESPYLDDYDASKGYTAILALPGRAEQAREFTQAQTIQRDFTERLGKAVFADGAVISGCNLLIDGRNVTITEGQMFLEGLVRNIPETHLEMTGSGIERVLARIKTEIVTEVEDASLRDPAQGYENYGNAGAYREKQTVEFVIVPDDNYTEPGTTVFDIEDGEIRETTNDVSDYSIFHSMLAERTFDESGNFKVSGLDIQSAVTYNELADKIKVSVSAGKAYVGGYEVTKNTTSNVQLNPSKQTRLVQGESHVYSSTLNKYEISNFPVNEIRNVTCAIQVTENSKTRGSIKGGYDALIHTPVKEIVNIPGYTQYVDYKLYNDQVDWSLNSESSTEPSVGSVYSVTYIYNKSMVKGEDYDIINENGKSYLVFLDDGDKPTENSTFYIYYTYTLARRDLLLLDSAGEISVIEGSYDKFDSLITPYNRDKQMLNIGYVDIYPTYEGQTELAETFNIKSVRLTQANLYTMLQRLEALELNIAEMDSDREASEGEAASDLNGIFTDSFINMNKCDLNYGKFEPEGKPKFDCSIDYDNQELTVAADTLYELLTIDKEKSSEYGQIGNILSAPFDFSTALRQNFITGVMQVNPYAAYDPLCTVEVTPNVDKWMDTKTVNVYNTVDKTSYTYSSRVVTQGYWGWHASTTSTSTSLQSQSSATAIRSAVAESLIEYMRPQTITVKGKAFESGVTNIKCLFNDIEVPLTAIGSTKQLPDGKVEADGIGSFEATFVIPEKVPCGKVNVQLIGTDSFGNECRGLTEYSAEGTLLTTTVTNTTTVTRVYNVLTTRTNYYNTDPLAQSFMFNVDTPIAKLGLYFSAKDQTRPVVVQVRDMVNGYPGSKVYAEAVVDASDVKVSEDGSVMTEVELNQPVYCYADTYYCFVVISDCQSYSLFYAELGKNLLGSTTEFMSINPYTQGVLFSSSNASTWTAHQGADLKFDIFKTDFTAGTELVFNPIEIDSPLITNIMLDATYEDYKNVGITWMYRIDEDSVWLPIDSLVTRDLKAVTDTVYVKAVLKIGEGTSPYIAEDGINMCCFENSKKATYVSRALSGQDFDEKYQSLKISYQASLPSGSEITVYYMDEYDGEWNQVYINRIKKNELGEAETDHEGNNIIETNEFTTVSTKQIDEDFVQYDWEISKIHCLEKDGECGGSNFYRIRIDIETPLPYHRPRVKKLMSFMKFNDDYINEFG